MASNAVGSARDDTQTPELLAGTVGSHCANCHAPLASDQQYCLNCGERRGKSRFPIAATTAATEIAITEQQPPRRPPRGAGTTIVAGVATLLIALGVGVLIGHDSSSPVTRASAPTVVTVGGGSSATPGTGSGSTTANKNSKSTKASTAKGNPAKVKTVTVHLTPKVTKAATTAASKVFGSSGRLSSNATQKVGGSCSGGSGCQNHKFTGNFFSP